MPKKILLPLLTLLGASALIAGCGQKGPLYLPQAPAEPAPSITTGPPNTAPTSSTAVEPSGPAIEPAGEAVPEPLGEEPLYEEYPEEQETEK
ncbi:lipoprotein [Microbulbifer sp. MLAF003]|uniref:LPS translocon maturation chaperone LptM n=1 Tax=Microbulbifer TaxID=48073 RepID=UPI00036074FA|nr:MULTISPECIES: lipoprotein [Microbulbifer]WHI51058.1 lipoprotein [Microbulbifer sp. MLAF003]